MSSRRVSTRAAVTGSLVTAAFSAVLILSGTAVANDQQPMSGQGGKTVDKRPRV